MAKLSSVLRSQRPPKYKVQQHNRCRLCGRARGYMRRFGLCRICFRTYAVQGKIAGVKKSSW